VLLLPGARPTPPGHRPDLPHLRHRPTRTATGPEQAPTRRGGHTVAVIVLGIILAVLGWLAGISILLWIGIILVIVGGALALLGAGGHAVGPRRHYY
jgi:small-conductance mechanosensitive channel